MRHKIDFENGESAGRLDGSKVTHAVGRVGGLATLCGLSAVKGRVWRGSPDAINCPDCYAILAARPLIPGVYPWPGDE